jgi:hypothetical protein
LASAGKGTPSYVPVRVLVAAGTKPIPLTGARVRLLRKGRTIAVGKSYGLGLAIASAVSRRRIPNHFTVKTSGGFIRGKPFDGRLAGKVRRHRSGPTTVIVNPETTLSVKYCKRHRHLKVRGCQRQVARFLDLPQGSDLGNDLLGSQALDGRKLLKSAGGARHLPRYLSKLTKKMGKPGSPAIHSFHGTRPSSHVVAPIPELASLGAAGRGGAPNVADDSSWWNFLRGVNVAIGLINQVAGWLSPNAPDSDAAQLANIDSALNQITTQLTDLENEMGQLQSEVTLGNYSTLAEGAAPTVNAIQDGLSSYQAVLDAANQISCWPSNAGSCPNPQSPADVCQGASGPLQNLCVTLGDLPLPANLPPRPYTNPNSPNALTGSLIGQFMYEITSVNSFSDSQIQALANDAAGGLGGGSPGTAGIWQFGSAYLAAQTPFLGTPTDQEIQDMIGYYMSAYTAGLTMRGAFWGFDQFAASTYNSAVNTSLADFSDLTEAAPAPLPGGTFLDQKSGLMWSGWLGAIENAECPADVAEHDGQISLPYPAGTGGSCSAGINPLTDTPNNAPGWVTPQLANGQTIADWSIAGQDQVQDLSANLAPYTNSGTQATYLVNNGLFAGPIISNVSAGKKPQELAAWPNGVTSNQQLCDLTDNTPGCEALIWLPGINPWDVAAGDSGSYEGAPLYDFPSFFFRTPVAAGPNAECYYYPQSGSTALSECAPG